MLHIVCVYLNTCAAILGSLFLVLAPVAASADTSAATNLIMTAAAMALVAVICRLCAVLVERI